MGDDESEIPDAWHHQTVYAVDGNSVFLTYPLETVSKQYLELVINSPQTLLVRRSDVLNAYNRGNDMSGIRERGQTDPRWIDMKVIGGFLNFENIGPFTMQRAADFSWERGRVGGRFLSFLQALHWHAGGEIVRSPSALWPQALSSFFHAISNIGI